MWILPLTGSALAFKKARSKLSEVRYIAAALFVIAGIVVAGLHNEESDAKQSTNNLEIWYTPNAPFGIARGINPGRVAWGHNPAIASWDGKTGFWWEERFNNQAEADNLLTQTLLSVTGIQEEKKS